MYKGSRWNNILSFKAQVITTAYLNEKKNLEFNKKNDKKKKLKAYLSGNLNLIVKN